MSKQILVVSENNNIQHEIIEKLSSDGDQVVYVNSVGEALKTFMVNEYSFVILNDDLYECDGYRLLEVMQAARPIPVLMLSTKNNQNIASERDNVPPDENQDRWNSFHDILMLPQKESCFGGVYKKDTNQQYTLVCGRDLIITPARREVLLKGVPANLTKTEFDLLFCLASHPGQVLSREQLYNYVWGEDSAFNIDDVVKAHIKAIRKKLSPAKVEYIHNVWGVGYCFRTDGDSE